MKKKLMSVVLVTSVMFCSGCGMKETAREYASAKFNELSQNDEFITNFNNFCDSAASMVIKVLFKERPTEVEANE